MSILSKRSCSNLNSTRQNSPVDWTEQDQQQQQEMLENNFLFRPIRRDEESATEYETDTLDSLEEFDFGTNVTAGSNDLSFRSTTTTTNTNEASHSTSSSGSTPSSDIWILPGGKQRGNSNAANDDSLTLNQQDIDGTRLSFSHSLYRSISNLFTCLSSCLI
jgi:hypothetical protein